MKDGLPKCDLSWAVSSPEVSSSVMYIGLVSFSVTHTLVAITAHAIKLGYCSKNPQLSSQV